MQVFNYDFAQVKKVQNRQTIRYGNFCISEKLLRFT